jgi:hypothetical protein
MMVLDWRILQPETVKQIATANPTRESRYFMFRPLFTARKLTNMAVYPTSRHQEQRFKASLRWKLPLSANTAANRRFNEATACGSLDLIGCSSKLVPSNLRRKIESNTTPMGTL